MYSLTISPSKMRRVSNHVDKMKTFKHNFELNSEREPMDVSYHCNIVVNGVNYRLRALIKSNKIYTFQAIRMNQSNSECELITKPSLLGALTELIVEQYSKSPTETRAVLGGQ